ncbi:MAG: hypothetical protein MPW17_21310 [Candidatus Manganitrophus sp.]|nr:hypothetical protein [Candidatus Manganitrophus sp.]MDC4222841.1 hypothetical protein [Candidatus Manganitrophus sp.]WDT71237.1 MAG: hypothetical protein MPW17_21310 [Candidatus Manganitrophus sp.]
MEIPPRVRQKRKIKKASLTPVRREKASENGAGASFSPSEVQQIIAELRNHQHELEAQNDELRRTQAELEASRNRYSDLYDFAPVGYFTLSRSGLILEANLKGRELLGVDRDFQPRTPFSLFVFKRDQPLFHAHRRSLFKGGSGRSARSGSRPRAEFPFMRRWRVFL